MFCLFVSPLHGRSFPLSLLILLRGSSSVLSGGTEALYLQEIILFIYLFFAIVFTIMSCHSSLCKLFCLVQLQLLTSLFRNTG